MSRNIKYSNNIGKNVSFNIENYCVLVKYDDIWNKIKKKLDIKFYSKLVQDEKYIKTKVKTFKGVVNTVFLDDRIPRDSIHYIYIATINIHS